MERRTPEYFIDKIILDRYKLTEPLGPGAGYLALDLHPVPSSSREPVVRAVKVIKKAGPSNSWDTWRQRLEIALHQRVTGTPNILTLHATTEDDDFLYLVTDYHKYNMLQVVCYDRIPYIGNDELVRSVFVQLIDAVAVCHNRNVFHRDLKPENIRCNADGSEVYISNFGLATQQRFTSTYGYGTMSYKSPECIGEECDSDIYATRLGDIWALGVILVNMLTGCTPWDKAVTTDKDFNDFLHNDDYLRRTFAISEETIIMLERMFSIDPISRLTLDEVRSSFLEIPTFFRQKASSGAPTIPDIPDESELATLKARPIDAATDDSEGTAPSDDGKDTNFFSYGLDESYPFPLVDSASSSSESNSGPVTPRQTSQPPVAVSEFAEDLGEALRPLAAKAEELTASPMLKYLERIEMIAERARVAAGL